MKRSIFISILATIIVNITFAQNTTPRIIPVNNEAFKPGEKLKFRVHFGFIDAGGNRLEGDRKLEAELTIRAGKIVWDLNGISAKQWKQ